MPDFEVRALNALAEFQAAVALQELTWGPGFSERVPVSLMKVSQRLGGVAAGAYDGEGVLVGFVFGLPGWENGSPVHWSDILAVRPEIRDSGVGTRMKAYQREVVLAAGAARMYWTFDPLESRNAYLNFAKLGVVVREHVRDMYGQSDSPLHRGIGTDRFIALWLLETPRVEGRLGGREPPPDLDALSDVPRVLGSRPGKDGAHPEPGERADTDGARALVAIPADIQAVKADAPHTAARWREATRPIFVDYLARGYEIRELVRGGEVSHYLLERDAPTAPDGSVADRSTEPDPHDRSR